MRAGFADYQADEGKPRMLQIIAAAFAALVAGSVCYAQPADSSAPLAAPAGALILDVGQLMVPEGLKDDAAKFRVTIRINVAADGSASVDLNNPSPNPALNQFYVEHYRNAKYFPAIQDGKPVVSSIALVIRGDAGRATLAWADRVASLIRRRIPLSVADAVTGNPNAVFVVTLLTGREVGSIRLVKASGFPAYDEAAMHAIQAISPLPPFPEGMEPVPVLRLEIRPRDQ